MRTIYIGNDYKCHVSNDGTMKEVETGFFDGKCTKFIEGYRYIPPGESWTRSDGVVFQGEMISPWKDYNLLAAYQEAYDETKETLAEEKAALEAENADLKTAFEIMGGTL